MKSAIHFGLSEEQVDMRDALREFVRKEVRPRALEREWAPDVERIPWDWIEGLSKMGVRTMPVPEEFGGSGADCLSVCIAGEELAAGDLGLAVAMDQTWKLIPLITTACTGEQRQRYLPAFMADPRYLLAVGLHEDNAGSDHFLPFNEPPHGARTRAVQEAGGDWILDGAKTYISNGGAAKLHIVMARTEPGSGGARGLTPFFVELGTPGFRVGRVDDKLGQRLVQNAELIFEHCRLPDSLRLGERGRGMRTYGLALKARGLPQVAATAVGVARAAFEAALAHASSHVQGGTQILNHDSIGLMLADMDLRVETARLLTWKAAWAVDHEERVNNRLPEMAKEIAAESAVSVCLAAMQVFGGAGVMLDQPVQKYVRDALTFFHSEGTNQVMRLRRVNLLRREAGLG
jgi:alkylation response protein AidB-like acyl-CoA dehydrogenase